MGGLRASGSTRRYQGRPVSSWPVVVSRAGPSPGASKLARLSVGLSDQQELRVNLERELAFRPIVRNASAIRTWLASIFHGITVEDALARRADNFLILRIIAAALVIYGHAPHIAPAVSGSDLFVRMHWGIYSGDIAVN